MNPKQDFKRPRGRPARPMPSQIPDTPENVARAVLSTPPKKRDEWEFMRKLKAAK